MYLQIPYENRGPNKNIEGYMIITTNSDSKVSILILYCIEIEKLSEIIRKRSVRPVIHVHFPLGI